MGTNPVALVETSTFTAAVYPPLAGTPALAGDVASGEQALANRTRYLGDTAIIALDVAGCLALTDDVVLQYQRHIANSGGAYHNPVDNVNTVGPYTPTSVGTIPDACTRATAVRAGLLAHMANTGGTFHDFVDDVRGPLLTAVPAATEIQSLRTLLIALKTYLNDHEAGNNSGANQVHPVNDVTNTVTAAQPTIANIIGPVTVDGVPLPGAVNVQSFTAAGTWTKPTVGVPSVTRVLAIGNGGGGGSGARGTAARSGGAGGGGGARIDRIFTTSLLPATVSVTFGASGLGGAAQTVDTSAGNNGVDGGAVSFGTFLQARGGSGGQGGQLGANATGGAGGIGDSTGGSGGGGVSNAAGVSASISAAAAGGGGGGGADGASYGGGNGGVNGGATSAAAAGGTVGNAGQNGTPITIPGPGNGGGGGGGNNATSGGSGGAGGSYGGGGGGGGASENGFSSGAGGNGMTGFCLVITYF